MSKLNLPIVNKPIFKTELDVHIAYINAGNHLGHDSMVTLLQEARERFFRSHSGSEIDCEGLGIMIVNLCIEYKAEGMHGDKLTILLGLGNIGKASFEFHYQVFNQHHIEVARAMTTSVFCSIQTRKPTAIPEKIFHIFQKHNAV